MCGDEMGLNQPPSVTYQSVRLVKAHLMLGVIAYSGQSVTLTLGDLR